MNESKYRRVVGSQKDSLYYVTTFIDEGSSVLDVGCWEGALGNFLIEEMACTVDGIELNLEAAKKAQQSYRNVNICDLDNFDISSFSEQYDYIVCADILEHLRNPNLVISQLKKLLRPGGKFVISLPNIAYGGVLADLHLGKFDYRKTGILDDTHLRFFTRSSAIELLNKSGLSVKKLATVQMELERSEFSNSLRSDFDCDLRKILAKKEDSGSYQFVLLCNVSNEQPEIELIDLGDNKLKFQTEVFWPNEDSLYTAENSVSQPASLTQANKLTFNIPTSQVESQIRLDISSFKGYFEIMNFCVKTSNEEVMFDIKIDKAACNVNSGKLTRNRDGNLIFVATSDDSSIEVPVETKQSRDGLLTVEVEFKYLCSLEEYSNLKMIDSERLLFEKNIALISQELENNAKVIQALKQSTSWKLTSPIRALSYLAKGDKNSLRLAIAHKFPWLLNIMAPSKGSLSEKINRAASSMLKHGPIATLKKIKRVGHEKPLDEVVDYQDWLRLHELQEVQNTNKIIQRWPQMEKPLISIIMTTHNTNLENLRLSISSVLEQLYPNWELYIVADKTINGDMKKYLHDLSLRESRVEIITRREDKVDDNVSNSLNKALDMCEGQWICQINPNDEIHRNALSYVTYYADVYPECQLIYTDEDKIDQSGTHVEPHFKSGWNVDLLYSQNYLSNLCVYKLSTVRKVGGYNSEFEGGHDYELTLRYTDYVKSENITHIPQVLYHKRLLDKKGTTTSEEASKRSNAEFRALVNFFKSTRPNVNVTKSAEENIFRVKWPIKNEPLVSLIVPTYNGKDITKQAIDSILEKTEYRNFEIILVDNNSDAPEALEYFNEIDKHDKVTVLRYPYKFNYSAINNFAAMHSKGEIIGLINNDIEVINAEWLTEMVSQVQRDDIGCVGAMLYYPDETVQHSGVIVGMGGVAGHSHKLYKRGDGGYFNRLKSIQNYTAVTAACLLVRKPVFEEVAGLNELDLTVAFNDVDFCLKVHHAGYRNLWTPYAELYHHESVSRGLEDNPEKIARFHKEIEYMYRTWNTAEYSDSSYSQNLNLFKEDFSIAPKSRFVLPD